jgi:COP9 signalosome complex subunit 2
MSDSEDYEYEYDDSDQEAMDDADGADGGNDEDQSFDYTDDDENPNGGDGDDDDGEIALENAYYNAKAERDAGDVEEARQTFERVIRMEVDQNKKTAGVIAGEDDGGGSGNTAMDVEGVSSSTKRLTPLKYHGLWSYKAIKQLVKLHLRSLDGKAILKDYSRMLRVASTPDAAISPNAMEKGVNGMLDRVSNIISQSTCSTLTAITTTSDPRIFARGVYDLTLEAFHPTTGISPNERLWLKTNLKYGQLLYEMNETAKLQLVIRDLLISSGQPTDILGCDASSSSATTATEFTTSSGGTHLMEIAALQIQLYSRLKDTKKLRAAYHRAMTVQGGIPHPRTLALIQELGGKMNMSQRNFHEASQSFFQAFKSYDEAGDRSRLRCLKYLVMASMLHASSINPFDSHEARAHRDDPEIVAMTNLVQAFHNGDIRKFEHILKKNEGHIMDDEFVREHVAELLRTIRTQVIMRTIGPYTRVRLERIAKDLNDIPVEDVESLLVSLILDGKLAGGLIDQVNGILVKKAWTPVGGEKTKGPAAVDTSAVDPEVKYQASLMWLTSSLEHLSCVVSKV